MQNICKIGSSYLLCWFQQILINYVLFKNAKQIIHFHNILSISRIPDFTNLKKPNCFHIFEICPIRIKNRLLINTLKLNTWHFMYFVKSNVSKITNKLFTGSDSEFRIFTNYLINQNCLEKRNSKHSYWCSKQIYENWKFVVGSGELLLK